MTTNRLSDPRAQRVAAVAGLCLLVVVLTPQEIIQAGGGIRLDPGYGGATALGALMVLVVAAGFGMLAQTQSRSSDYQVVARYLSSRSAVVAASSKLITLILIVVLGAGLALNALAVTADLEKSGLSLAHAGLVVLLAMPAMLVRTPGPRFVLIALIPAAAAVAAIIVGGLIIELTGGLTTIPETETIDGRPVASGALIHRTLGALLPAAVLGLLTERTLGEGAARRLKPRSLAGVMLPVLAAIGALLYLSYVIALPATTRATPVLALGEAFFGETGENVIAIAFIAAGLAVGLAAAGQAMELLRQLAADGILPRRAAAADARRPRRAFLAVTVLIGTAPVFIPGSAATAVVILMLGAYALTMAAIIARGRAIKRASTVLSERKSARQSSAVATVTGAAATAAIIAALISQPVFAASAVAIAGLLAGILLVTRRGAGKIGARLAASDLSAGRTLPTRVHAIVLVERLDRPTLQAITYVRATRPSTITGLVVDVDPEVTEVLTRDWMAAELPVELRILGTPRGAARRPVIEHVRSLRTSSPRDIVIIYAPRVVSPSAIWQRFFVRHSTPALLSELKLEPGVIVAEVPYQIEDVEEQ